MGYRLTAAGMNAVLAEWKKEYAVYAPFVFKEGGPYSDADVVRYGEAEKIEDIVFDTKSAYSFKEFILPLSQTLFFFTEDSVKEADCESDTPKGAIILLRSCDLHAVKRLDEIYLRNDFEDYYYKRLRERVKFVLIGCPEAFDNCFCADMGTNKSDNYDAGLYIQDGSFLVDNKDPEWDKIFSANGETIGEVEIPFVTEGALNAHIPDHFNIDAMDMPMCHEYDTRCINCGRCNFVCPTCTCFTMQDIFYTDNGRVGERRRVWASCMLDGYTDVAGGGSYRKSNGERMRFKNMHKVHDFKERFGYQMCVGCGRCDDICPEYISFIESIRKLARIENSTKGAASNGNK